MNLTFAVSRKRDSTFLCIIEFKNQTVTSKNRNNPRWLKTQGHFTNYVSFGNMCLLFQNTPCLGSPIGSLGYGISLI